MVQTDRGLLVAAALLAATWASADRCQGQPLPPVPIPVAATTPPPAPSGEGPVVVSTLPHPTLPPSPVPVPVDPVVVVPSICPPPPACAPYEDCNGPLLIGDPLLDRPCAAKPGWFTTLEADLVAPHIKNRLIADVNVANLFVDTVHLPTAPLDATGALRAELGYRFAQGFGELLVAYRGLTTTGSGSVTGFDPGGDGDLHSRLTVSLVDLDYASREYSLGPRWDMKWRAGVRIGDVFFDSRAEGVFLEERTSNHYIGAGPHTGLDLSRSLGCGCALFGRLEGAALLGKLTQEFEENWFLPDGSVFGGLTRQWGTQALLMAHVQAGLSWAPEWRERRFRLVGGYEWEQYWYAGHLNDSRAELTVQGVFLRAEWNY